MEERTIKINKKEMQMLVVALCDYKREKEKFAEVCKGTKYFSNKIKEADKITRKLIEVF